MPLSNLKKDLFLVTVIGLLVGFLIQPVLSTTEIFSNLADKFSVPQIWLRVLIILFFVILAPFALYVASRLAKFIGVLYQIAKFAAVGTLNSFIDLGVFNLLVLIFFQPEGGTFASGVMKTVSFLAATTNSYVWNTFWTFGEKSVKDTSRAVKFYAITGFNWLINTGVFLAVSALRPEDELWVNIVSPICGIFAGMAGNFIGYKLFVFGKVSAGGPTGTPPPISPGV
ncbi:MAG: GtrA family protein [Candidatus Liptonbacteria bacterium]